MAPPDSPGPSTGANRPDIVVFDYGFGNVRSATRAVEVAGAKATLTSDPDRAVQADGLVVPGVGAFSACMRGLVEADGPRIIQERVALGRPVLGICVGLQILFEASDEFDDYTPGLGVLPGTVRALNHPIIPHMGWNTVNVPAGSRLFTGVQDRRFYFVHSFAVPAAPIAGAIVTTCRYGSDFVAAVESGPVAATQFHPEKSGSAGVQLLRNWLNTV